MSVYDVYMMFNGYTYFRGDSEAILIDFITALEPVGASKHWENMCTL